VSLSKAENLSRITSLPLLEQVATTASAATSEGNDASLADSLVRNLSQNLMEHVMASSPQQVIQSNDDDDGTDGFSLLRMLEIGDFEDLNELFEGAVINLPDADISTSGLTLEVRNLRCKEISIGDIQVGYQKNSNQQLTFQLEVIDLDLNATWITTINMHSFVEVAAPLRAPTTTQPRCLWHSFLPTLITHHLIGRKPWMLR